MLKAKIYRPSKNVMQSGRGKLQQWVLEYDQDINRSPEALMGWTQSDSTLSQVKLSFDDLESAKAYAEEKGLLYTVSTAHERKVKPRNYGDNFKYVAPPSPAPAAASKSKPKKKAVAKKTTKAATKKTEEKK